MSSSCSNCNPQSFPCDKTGEIATGSASVVINNSASSSISSSAGAS